MKIMRVMLSLFVVSLCLGLSTSSASAQLRLGIKGGATLSRVSLSGDKSNLASKNRSGFFVGPMVDAKIPFFGLGMDVSALYAHSYLDNKFTETTVKSIEVPVNVKWSASILRLFGIYAALGPQFGFNIGERNDSHYLIRKRHASFNTGGGIVLLDHVQFGVNYNFALTRTATLQIPVEMGGNYNVKVKNNSWQVSLAYLF